MMSHQRILKALVNLGLTEADAKVYVYLAMVGCQKLSNVARVLKIPEKSLGKTLMNLRHKKLLEDTVTGNGEFFAVPFGEALEKLIEAHLEETQNIERQKELLMREWRSIIN